MNATGTRKNSANRIVAGIASAKRGASATSPIAWWHRRYVPASALASSQICTNVSVRRVHGACLERGHLRLVEEHQVEVGEVGGFRLLLHALDAGVVAVELEVLQRDLRLQDEVDPRVGRVDVLGLGEDAPVVHPQLGLGCAQAPLVPLGVLVLDGDQTLACVTVPCLAERVVALRQARCPGRSRTP